MDDARRFLRYVTPGLVFLTESLGLLVIVIPDWAIPAMHESLGDSSSAALVIGTLVASGGIGYLFGVVHHALHWIRSGAPLNHTACIRALIDQGELKVADARTRQAIKASDIDRSAAWVILTALWYTRVESDQSIKGANDRASGLADLAHSTGTAFVASVAALVLAVSTVVAVGTVVLEWEPVLRYVVGLGLGLAISWVLWRGSQRTAELARGVIDEVLTDVLVRTSGLLGVPVETHLTSAKVSAS